MKWLDRFMQRLGESNPRLLSFAEKRLKAIPAVNQRIEKEYDDMMAGMERVVKPYRDEFASFTQIPDVGAEGYLTATQKILETAQEVKNAIRQIPELRLLGDPLFVIPFASDSLDIYRVLDEMTHRGWSLNGLHKPSCVHLCVTLRHAQPGVAQRFLRDLQAAVAFVKRIPTRRARWLPFMAWLRPFHCMEW